jgi:hypothetical protein
LAGTVVFMFFAGLFGAVIGTVHRFIAPPHKGSAVAAGRGGSAT